MITSGDGIESSFRVRLAARPDVRGALEEMNATALESVDPVLLTACRVRIAMLLGHTATLLDPALPAGLVADLPRWPSSARFSAAQRACLAFTEQFVVDVSSMDDATVAAVEHELGPVALMDFTHALLAVEQRIRLDLMWGRLFGAEAR